MKTPKAPIAAALFLVVGAAFLHFRPDAPPSLAPSKEALLPDLDLAAVRRLRVEAADGTLDATLRDGLWVLPGLADFPVDFPHLRDFMRELATVKAGVGVLGGEAMPEEFGLDASATTITWYGAEDKALGSLKVGKERFGGAENPMGFGPMPDGQYVRAGEGPVRLLPETLRGLPRGPLGWVDTRLFSMPPAEIDTLSVFPADGTNYVLKVKGFSEFELLGASTNQTLDATKAGALARAFQYMTFSGIETAQTNFTAEVRIDIAGKDGTRVNVELGPGELLRYTATHTPPAESTEDSADTAEAARKEVEALAARSRWTYRIGPESAAALRHQRADLIQKETP